MLAIIDYGVGNLFSLQSSLRFLDIDCCVTGDAAVIEQASHIILPGVGAFGDAAAKLRQDGLDQVVIAQAQSGKPLLGICVGMQLLFEKSLEFGEHAGLGLLSGTICPLREHVGQPELKIPHMGWNSLTPVKGSPLLENFPTDAYVYYVHSFFVPPVDSTLATSQYGDACISGLVGKGRLWGAQFHPEKSGRIGLELLRSFAST